MTTIGFLGFGEVASRFAAALVLKGAEVLAYDVLLDRPGGREKLQGRLKNGTSVTFTSLPEMARRAEYVLSTVTTDVALRAAGDCVPYLRPGLIYVDLNATSPAVKRQIAATVADTGADFVEGAILGAVGVTGARTRILLCGAKAAQAAATLTRFGLNAADYGLEIGKASAFKLLRSVFSKGVEALLIEALLAARRAGVEADVWHEIVETLDERPFAEVGGNWVRTHGSAHVRRYHEMAQVAALLRDLGLEPVMTDATTRVFARSMDLALAERFQAVPEKPEQVVAALDAALREKAQ